MSLMRSVSLTHRAAVLALLAFAACPSCGQGAPPSADAAVRVDGAEPDARSLDRSPPPEGPRPDAAPPKQKLRVLFVGNSYTFVNDLPGTVVGLAASVSQPPDLQVSSHAEAGAMFMDHYTNAATLADVGSGAWTHVVLQGQSLEAVASPALFATYGLLLAQKASSANSLPVLYETWARKAGDAIYSQPYSGGSPKAMQALLRSGYEDLATKSAGLLARVGDAWEEALASDPTLELYADDGSHPTVLGTYLAACVFYGVLTGRSPLEISTRPSSTTDAVAVTLRTAAAKVTSKP